MSDNTKNSENSKSTSKVIPLTLGAVAMMIFGAAATCAVNKILTPTHLNGSDIIVSPSSPAVEQPTIKTEKAANVLPVTGKALPADVVSSVVQSEVPPPVPTTQKFISEPCPVPPSAPQEVMAKIIDIQPQYTTKLVPYRSCKMIPRPVYVRSQRAIDGSGTVLGGVTGGLLGHQIGKGNGNIAATVGGVIVGSLMGNNIEREINRPEVHYVYDKVCQTRHTEKTVITGYKVTYSYDGKEQTKFMKTKPKSDHMRLELAPVAS